MIWWKSPLIGMNFVRFFWYCIVPNCESNDQKNRERHCMDNIAMGWWWAPEKLLSRTFELPVSKMNLKRRDHGTEFPPCIDVTRQETRAPSFGQRNKTVHISTLGQCISNERRGTSTRAHVKFSTPLKYWRGLHCITLKSRGVSNPSWVKITRFIPQYRPQNRACEFHSHYAL